jgi:hypothetical protein
LAEVSFCAALNQGLLDAHANAVHVTPGVNIVERVHDEIEAREE